MMRQNRFGKAEAIFSFLSVPFGAAPVFWGIERFYMRFLILGDIVGRKTVEYPGYLFTDPSGAEHVAQGRYRVVQQLSVGNSVDIKGGEEVTLYCEFSVTAP